MTIGIGVLATETNAPSKPNTVILMADTKRSFEDQFSHQRLHKTFAFPEVNLFATAADRIDRAAALMPIIAAHLGAIAASERNYGNMVSAIATACFVYKGDLFRIEVLPQLRISPDSFDRLKKDVPQHVDAEIQKIWEKFRIGCELIIGTFGSTGQAFLFATSGFEQTAQNVSFPGFAAIGSGAGNAEFWLSRRGHTSNMSVRRSAYHAYEAKLMAESAAGVNEELDCIVARAGKSWVMSTHRRNEVAPDCSITFDWLEEQFKKLSVRGTDKTYIAERRQSGNI